MKACKKCGEEKALNEFRKNPVGADGLRTICRACDNVAAKAYAADHKEEKSAYNAKYAAENREEIAAKRYVRDQLPASKARKAKEDKKYSQSEKGKVARVKANAKWVEENPEAKKAQQMVQSAVRRGDIPPASMFFCNTDCGQMAVDYHHFMGTDEKNWYDIVPLCRKCHRAEPEHKTSREG